MALSSKRRQLLNKIFSLTGEIITIDNTSQVLGLSREETRQVLQKFEQTKWIKRIHPGIYVRTFVETLDPDLTQENPFIVASHVFSPCYVGGWSAASHWGLTDQLFNITWIFTTKPFRQKEATLGSNNYILTHIKEPYFFGMIEEWVNNQKVLMSDPHKTLIDFAEFIEQFGLTSLIDVFTAYMHSEHKDLDKLKDHMFQNPHRVVFKRIGFLLEKYFPHESSIIEVFKGAISKGYSSIYPKVSCPRIIKKWNLKVPKEMA